jgi:hypothetical protein
MCQKRYSSHPNRRQPVVQSELVVFSFSTTKTLPIQISGSRKEKIDALYTSTIVHANHLGAVTK